MKNNITYADIAILPFIAGDVITIPKGTKVLSAHPRKDVFYTKKIMRVKISHFRAARILYCYGPISIVWKGSGGYWNESDINDILSDEMKKLIIAYRRNNND